MSMAVARSTPPIRITLATQAWIGSDAPARMSGCPAGTSLPPGSTSSSPSPVVYRPGGIPPIDVMSLTSTIRSGVLARIIDFTTAGGK